MEAQIVMRRLAQLQDELRAARSALAADATPRRRRRLLMAEWAYREFQDLTGPTHEAA